MRKRALFLLILLAALLLAGACKQTITFGVVSDIQYHPGKPLGTRFYSASLNKLKEALARFNQEKVDFVVNFGDTIDHDIQAFDGVMPIFGALKSPAFHIVGNHDFNVRAGDEDRALPALGLKQAYHAFDRAKWRFVFLDGFELRYPFPADKTLKEEAETLYVRLRAQGRNNAQPSNGGLSLEQISWLEDKLEEADTSAKKALVLCHFPVLPEAAYNLWNDKELVSVLERHRSVKAYFSGHYHLGNYAFQNGIHYLTFKGMVETPDQNAFAVVTLEKSAIQVRGFGREPNRTLRVFDQGSTSSTK